MRIAWMVLLAILAAPALSAQTSVPANTGPDNPAESYQLEHRCFSLTFQQIADCAEELFTGQPVHVAVGSIAPEDGFGAGLAYLGHLTTENWRTSWDVDGIASGNGSWRAGVYLKLVDTKEKLPTVQFGTKGLNPKENLASLPERPVISLYVQTITLNKLRYFGLGPTSVEADRSFFGMRQTIVGGSAIKPFAARLSAALYGEIDAHFVSLRRSVGQPSPSIEQLYTEATAPGLTNQPTTLQFGEGIRIRPVWAADRVRLNYDLSYKQFVAPGSNFSFQRLTVDLGHEFALYGKTTRNLRSRPSNGPDDCAVDAVTHPECPKAYVRNFEGTLGIRFLAELSMTPGGNVVPFYFQPTLGGTDINGNPSLSSYQDYRFRAPNVMLIRESFEHSIWNLPIGFALMADEGKVTMTRAGLGHSPWLHSFSSGLTLRAGGFPQVYLLFAWGGNEGTHAIANVNTSLLGGASRPSLY